MTNLTSLPDLKSCGRTSRFLLSLVPENIVLFRQQTIYGYRLMGGFVDMSEFDTSYAEINICCGAEIGPYNDMFCNILIIINKNPTENPFKGIPQVSKIKPYFNDREFCEIISALVDDRRNISEWSVATNANFLTKS